MTRAAIGPRPGPGERPGPESAFWAVTSYFNPASWSTRRRNYRIFRDRLELPLLTVELAGAAGGELATDDADLYLRVTDGDVLWQKERLLNLAFAALPRHVTHVAWIDCDVVFTRSDWWRLALEAMRRHAAVQLFERALHLAPVTGDDDRAAPGAPRRARVIECVGSAAAAFDGRPRRPGFSLGLPTRHRRAPGQSSVSKGFAWAATRELMESLGLYDRGIVGGGDSSALAAFVGDAEALVTKAAPARRTCLGGLYEEWARHAFDLVGGRVGSIPGDLLHLWHGPLEGRAYSHRHEVLARHGFEVDRDLRLGEDGAWRWASEKPGLHAGVASYLVGRREDDGTDLVGEETQQVEVAPSGASRIG